MGDGVRPDLGELTTAPFSTIVESDRPLIVDRTVSWDANGYGSHAETAVQAPATRWYFAEGTTSGAFNLFYLLQNPGDATEARVTYLRPGAPPITRTYPLPGRSRTTIHVDADDDLASTDVSAVLEADDPISPRAMYLDGPDEPFAAGHGSAGVTAPATTWLLGEGATGPFFDLFLLLANPNTDTAQVTITYLLSDGRTFTKLYTVEPESRTTIWVDGEEIPAGSGDTPLANVAVSMTIQSPVPIVVERTMWWPGPGISDAFWTEAHNSVAAQQAGQLWAVAEGEVGGTRAAETYLLVANVDAAPVDAVVTLFFEDGTSTSRTLTLGARSRTNVRVADWFPAATGRRFSATVEASRPDTILVERSMYTSTGGQVWNAGTNSLGVRLR